MTMVCSGMRSLVRPCMDGRADALQWFGEYGDLRSFPPAGHGETQMCCQMEACFVWSTFPVMHPACKIVNMFSQTVGSSESKEFVNQESLVQTFLLS